MFKQLAIIGFIKKVVFVVDLSYLIVCNGIVEPNSVQALYILSSPVKAYILLYSVHKQNKPDPQQQLLYTKIKRQSILNCKRFIMLKKINRSIDKWK